MSFVGATFEGPNEIIMKWDFYRMQRSVSSIAPDIYFFERLQIENVMGITLTTCSLSEGVKTQQKLKTNRKI